MAVTCSPSRESPYLWPRGLTAFLQLARSYITAPSGQGLGLPNLFHVALSTCSHSPLIKLAHESGPRFLEPGFRVLSAIFMVPCPGPALAQGRYIASACAETPHWPRELHADRLKDTDKHQQQTDRQLSLPCLFLSLPMCCLTEKVLCQQVSLEEGFGLEWLATMTARRTEGRKDLESMFLVTPFDYLSFFLSGNRKEN